MSKNFRRLRLLIGYDGTNFSGWQRQKNAPTIQEEIELQLSAITQEEIVLYGAGRTDAGVHAEGMIAHFDTTSSLATNRFFTGLNSLLPGAIRIYRVEECEKDFHARFSAVGKWYRYHLFTGEVQPPAERFYALHVLASLDFDAIQRGLTLLTGTHDFASFENSGTRDKTITTGRGAVRTLFYGGIDCIDHNHLCMNFIGDGFLKNMVRNMVGTLLEVGRHKISPDELLKILVAKDRTMARATAPAHGLFLEKVFYELKGMEVYLRRF